MRSKEQAHDYRYFPDPDLLPLVVEESWVEGIRASLPELPEEREKRFVAEYGLPEYDAGVLTAMKSVADYYERAVRIHHNPKALSNWVMGEVLKLLKDGVGVDSCRVSPENLASMVRLIDEDVISGKIAKMVFEEMAKSGRAPREIVEEQGLKQLTDPSIIEQVAERVLKTHAGEVEQYRGGKDRLFAFFVGQIMKETGGKANRSEERRVGKECRL